MFFSKCAVLLLCQRLTPKKGHWVAIWAILGLSACWAVSSILLLTIQCNTTHPWAAIAEQCTNLVGHQPNYFSPPYWRPAGHAMEGDLCFGHYLWVRNILLCDILGSRTSYVVDLESDRRDCVWNSTSVSLPLLTAHKQPLLIQDSEQFYSLESTSTPSSKK